MRVNSGQRTNDNVAASVALALTIIGGVIELAMLLRTTGCKLVLTGTGTTMAPKWSSADWIPHTVATAFVATGVVATVMVVRRASISRKLFWSLLWAIAICGVLVIIGWVSYSDEYTGCPDP